MNQDRRAIVVKGLRKSYKSVKAVDGISFHVHTGEIFGMVGPNGREKPQLSSASKV